jgi:hypothetical protein
MTAILLLEIGGVSLPDVLLHGHFETSTLAN